ncbi:site-specific integrase [Rhodanobacter sp. B2A1Ga4]|uniref:tyrosine-type recombinase/integrase n=1 Tax=Rhodanobacter sp. B2A1Ga4 TaxID=2778647 RepID=UPI001B398139|nr:site-specific integrase [Rhodanobacter sp. B2A1Ga4]MBQ4856237.1 site-specific integrase [Rhodanobacter sp. B2A1Ga4]
MANIRQLPSGSYNAQVRIKGHPQKSKTFPTEGEAQVWAKQQEALSKEHKAHTIYTLGMSYREARLKGRGSYGQALIILQQLSTAFPQPIHEITKEQVNKFKLDRLKIVKPSTVRTQLSFLSRFYRWAKRELLIDVVNPVADIALPAPSKPSDKVVSPEELALVIKELPKTMSLIVELAYESAMRRSEMTKLTPSCLHLEERIADVIDGKNGTRSVPLTRRAVELLQEALALMGEHASPKSQVFPVTPHAVSTAVRRARRLAGLDESVKLHQLRHTRITNVAKRGFNNSQIMIVSGHRDTRSVARYSHLNAKDVLHLID